MTGKKNLAVFISGGGSNLQAVLDAADSGLINGSVAAVVSSNAEAYGLIRARNRGVNTFVAKRSNFESAELRDAAIVKYLDAYKIDYIILAGYLGIITKPLLSVYPNRIINIHPSLLPKFGGRDYHGISVHKAVLEAGERFSGATVHFVDGGIDTGEILAQERLEVLSDDTPETLQKRILETIEHKLLLRVIQELCDGKSRLETAK